MSIPLKTLETLILKAFSLFIRWEKEWGKRMRQTAFFRLIFFPHSLHKLSIGYYPHVDKILWKTSFITTLFKKRKMPAIAVPKQQEFVEEGVLGKKEVNRPAVF